jgi:rare lipoprotein A
LPTKETTEAIGIVRKKCLLCIVILATISTGASAHGRRAHGHAPLLHHVSAAVFPRVGIATWYARTDKHGRVVHKNANGFHKTTSDHELLDPHGMTCATNGVPFNTIIKVTDLSTGTSIIVRVNDRMTARAPHIIDLTVAAAEKLGIKQKGKTMVRLEPIEVAETK